MSLLIKPTEAQWKVLAELGMLQRTQSMILISPHLSEEDRVLINERGERYAMKYDHGGEPDVSLDIVDDPGHYFLYDLRDTHAEV